MLCVRAEDWTPAEFRSSVVNGKLRIKDNAIYTNATANLHLTETRKDKETLSAYEEYWKSKPVRELDLDTIIDAFVGWLLIKSKKVKSHVTASLADILEHDLKLTVTNVVMDAYRRVSANLDELADILGGNVLLDYSQGIVPTPETFHCFCLELLYDIITSAYFCDDNRIPLDSVFVECKCLPVGPCWEALC